MNNQRQIMSLIKSVSGQSNILTIPRVYISLLNGDINAALLLNQIIYWSDRSSRSDGWFYKSYKEWEEEIGMSQFQVNRAAKKLKELNIIETKRKKANNAPTIHYRLNFRLLTNLIIEKLDYQETSLSNNLILDYQETSQSMDYQETSQSLTEITETTTKNKTKHSARDPLLDHPAVVAYRSEVHLTVPRTWRQQVADVVGEKPEQVAAWKQLVHDWVGYGWRPGNIKGMLEKFAAGDIRSNGTGAQRQINKNERAQPLPKGI